MDPAFALTNDTDRLQALGKQQHFATQNYSKPREPRFERNMGDYVDNTRV
jgi:hypothetical protein